MVTVTCLVLGHCILAEAFESNVMVFDSARIFWDIKPQVFSNQMAYVHDYRTAAGFLWCSAACPLIKCLVWTARE